MLPQPVTSLTVVSGWDGPSSTPGFLHPALRYLNGVVAVGMVQVGFQLLQCLTVTRLCELKKILTD